MTQWSAKNNTQIRDAVEAKKALPDMIQKRYIFDAWAKMGRAHATLNYNLMRNHNKPLEMDVYEFRSAILELFVFIGEMAKDNRYENLDDIQKYHKTDMELMVDLMNFKPLPLEVLVRLERFNLNLLHRLGLGDLLIGIPEDNYGIDTY